MKNSATRKKPGASPPAYSFYRSSRRPDSQKAADHSKPKNRTGLKLFSLLVLVLLIWGVYTGFRAKAVQAPAAPPVKSATTQTKTKTNTVVASVNRCSDNSLNQLILVSISLRHLWACNGSVQAYDSPVVTGMDFLAADLTPVGTYHIYAKSTDVYLKGSDSTGSWDDYVNYWMPFLDNQYGSYGFHDATWRPADAFGNISPASADASHGCVECPLVTAKWLYDWSQVGTTVTVES